MRYDENKDQSDGRIRCFLVTRDSHRELYRVAAGQDYKGPVYADGFDEWLAPGAMRWISGDEAKCLHDPPCDRHLVVICPDGRNWDIDGRANNCWSSDRSHHCWIRLGEPPLVTVGKLGGHTCDSGAGSIRNSATGHWWLIDGEFIEAQSGTAHPIEGI